ncbi:MAG: hypothetical protein ACRDJ4_15195, partial [Actinomycetota bacterium]
MGPDIEIESQAPGTQIPSLPISTIAAPSPLAAPAPEVDRRDEAEADLAIRELCHDLRQPVATIAALAEACRVTPGLSPEVQTRLLHI